MQILKENELVNTEGGAISIAVILGIVAVGVFIVGVIDGIMRPYKCRS